MDDAEFEALRGLGDRLLAPLRARTAICEATTAVMRDITAEIAVYTGRGEAAPPEVIERARLIIEMCEGG